MACALASCDARARAMWSRARCVGSTGLPGVLGVRGGCADLPGVLGVLVAALAMSVLPAGNAAPVVPCEAAVQRYWDEHGRETFDNRMQGLEAWPPCHGSGDPDAAAEVTVAMRADGYIARRAQDAILGCPAGVAFQHAALLVTQLVADHRPAPVRAPAPVQQPRDEAGLIIDANNAAYEVAEAADLAAQAAPSPGAARDAARAARAAQYQAGAAREAARAERGAQNQATAAANVAADAITDVVIAAPDAWRHLVGGGTSDAAAATAGADAAPSPPATRSAVRAAAAAAAQLRASSG